MHVLPVPTPDLSLAGAAGAESLSSHTHTALGHIESTRSPTGKARQAAGGRRRDLLTEQRYLATSTSRERKTEYLMKL